MKVKLYPWFFQSLLPVTLICLFPAFSGMLAQTPSLPAGFAQLILADSLNPTTMAFDHHGNLYLAQKDGRVFLVNEAGAFQADPVLSLSPDDFNERGLSGIALHPDFDNQPWLYLYYTVRDSNFNRLSRVRINGNHAVPGSEQWLFSLDPLSAGIHNGGSMGFGSDGKLYIGTGDGGNSSNGQSLLTTLGKVLRLNDDGSIPTDNPFYNTLQGNARAIYAYGLRNPFGMAIQPGSSRIFVSEVGQGAFEEVNEIMPGRNYGWSQIEGYIAAQIPPADYQDPFFAYPHSQGCAIVGAAFYNPQKMSFPASYADKFFFADYCTGTVQLLDPNTQTASETFATGLRQPVAFGVNPATGDLFYLMRSGIGGGSVIDNTSTNNGTLWRVFYTGSGAPFISVPPQDVWLAQGENALFELQVLGTPIFQYQWQRDGINLPGANAETLSIDNVQLTDDGALFRCIVTNAEGSDTSAAAILHVTSNQRPQPIINAPLAAGLYKAGETIHFQGFATDPENGLLPAAKLNWRIDLHHDTHIHPALAPVAGISEGDFLVPMTGETSTNTWYRIHLTAQDSGGLERSVFTDIFPDKTSVTIDGPAGIPVNLDGVIRPIPYLFEGLKRQNRVALATQQWIFGDTLFVFDRWREGTDQNLILNFSMPDSAGRVLHPEYNRVQLGHGTGLYGEYFNDPDLNLGGMPDAVRVDSVIQFAWGGSTPFPGQIQADNFSVRWRGFIEPVFSGDYSLHILSDDGCRLWIGDSLLIDWWIPQAGIERSGKIYLESGIQYPIRVEYMEIGGDADIKLSWSSPELIKAVVPKRQLYPFQPVVPAKLEGTVWLDNNSNGLADSGDEGLEEATLLLHSADSTFLSAIVSNAQGYFQFDAVAPGSYFVLALTNSIPLLLQPSFGINAFAQTAFFDLSEGEERAIALGFKVGTSGTNSPEKQAFDLNIAPNPVHDQLNITFLSDLPMDTKLSIADLSGRLQMVQMARPQVRNISLNLQQLLPGCYFLTAENELGRRGYTFIKY